MAIFIEKHLCLSLFLSCNFIEKETLAQGVSCKFCDTFFTENLLMTASILKQLLDLYFAIIYSWQLSSSEKSLVWTKKSSIYFKDFTDLEFFYFLLHKRYTVPWAANCFVGSETPKSNAFDQCFFPNTFQETHDFLILLDLLIISIYLRTTDWHFRDQENVVILSQSYYNVFWSKH